MKKIKISVLILIVALCLFGCSSKTSEIQEVPENTQQVENKNQPPEDNFKDMGMMGTIGEIDLENNTITIKSNDFGMQGGGNMPQGGGDKQEPPEMTGSEQPEMPSDDKQQPPEMPEGTDKGNVPEGQENFDPENIPEGMPKQGEESSTNYNVTEETVIKDASGNEISINELNVDDFISYTLDGDNLLTITIMNMDDFQQQPKQ